MSDDVSDDVTLEDRVDDAVTPSERDRTHLAALDIRDGLAQHFRRLVDGTDPP